MKVSTITVATALALLSTFAMAQSGSNSSDGIAISPATRSAMNSMHRKHHQHHGWSASRYNGWSASRYNGQGIDSLGVTTNQGRKYNGG
jgi:hypothetical protein